MKSNNVKSIAVSILTLAFAASAWARGDFGPGNGGDITRCESNSDNAFHGVYALDYLATFNPLNQNRDLVPVQSWEGSARRIRELLRMQADHLLPSFDEFVASIGNMSDYSQPRIWLPGPAGLVDIPDEHLSRMIPANCLGKGAASRSGIFQAVIRKERRELITYEIDPALFSEIQTRPEQLSFLLVHEWLRDFMEDSARIREINRFLHSRWESMPREKVEAALLRVGLTTKESIEQQQGQAAVRLLKAAIAGDLAQVRKAIEEGGDIQFFSAYNLKSQPWAKDHPDFQALFALQNTVSALELTLILGKHEVFQYLLGLVRYPSQDSMLIPVALLVNREDLAKDLRARGYPAPKDLPNVLLAMTGALRSDQVNVLQDLAREWQLPLNRWEVVEHAAKLGATQVLSYFRSINGGLLIENPDSYNYEWNQEKCGTNCYFNYKSSRSNPLINLIQQREEKGVATLLPLLSAQELGQSYEVTREKQYIPMFSGGYRWQYIYSSCQATVRALLEGNLERNRNGNEASIQLVPSQERILSLLKKAGAQAINNCW